jgi:hypothetical protein
LPFTSPFLAIPMICGAINESLPDSDKPIEERAR